MALNVNTLTTELETWMNNKNDYTTALLSIEGFANAYETYALDATGTLITYDKQGLIDAISSMTPGLTASQGATLFENSISAFWVGAVFSDGTVSINIIPGVLKSALQSTFEDLNSSISIKANQLATALDTSTKTIVIALTLGGTRNVS